MNKVVLWLILIAIAVSLVLNFAPKFLGGDDDHVVGLTNSSEYVVSRGLIVVHSDGFSLNQIGRVASKGYERLAEIGDPSLLIDSIAGNPEVYRVIEVGAVDPNSTLTVPLRDDVPEGLEAEVSYMAMVTATNDGVVWVNGAPLIGAGGERQSDARWVEVLDMGTEENSPVGSGFSGGQPDPERGDENVDNGVSTSEVVSHHKQFYEGELSPNILRFDLNRAPADSGAAGS